jgi:hypothetical protein
MGQICAMVERHQEASTLTAAADRLAVDLGVSPSERAVARREEQVDAMRTALGLEDFEKAWRTGNSFALDEAISFALALPVPST